MAENETPAAAAPEATVDQPQMRILGQFIRDMSFENIMAQKGAPTDAQPDYVGIFHIEGVPEDQMHPFLLIECPRMIFPFLRRIVSDVTRDGGFPPLNLENIDFIALYRNEIARRQAEAPAEPAPSNA